MQPKTIAQCGPGKLNVRHSLHTHTYSIYAHTNSRSVLEVIDNYSLAVVLKWPRNKARYSTLVCQKLSPELVLKVERDLRN